MSEKDPISCLLIKAVKMISEELLRLESSRKMPINLFTTSICNKADTFEVLAKIFDWMEIRTE